MERIKKTKVNNKKRGRVFSVVYEADLEGGFVAFIPALPGCRTQGETLEETERNVREAAAAYLESVLKETGALPREARTFQGTVEVAVPVSG